MGILRKLLTLVRRTANAQVGQSSELEVLLRQCGVSSTLICDRAGIWSSLSRSSAETIQAFRKALAREDAAEPAEWVRLLRRLGVLPLFLDYADSATLAGLMGELWALMEKTLLSPHLTHDTLGILFGKGSECWRHAHDLRPPPEVLAALERALDRWPTLRDEPYVEGAMDCSTEEVRSNVQTTLDMLRIASTRPANPAPKLTVAGGAWDPDGNTARWEFREWAALLAIAKNPERYAREQSEAAEAARVKMTLEAAESEYFCPEGAILGLVKSRRVKYNHELGFIQSKDGREFYFNPMAVVDLRWEDVPEGSVVTFEILREAERGKVGAATKVRAAQRSEGHTKARG